MILAVLAASALAIFEQSELSKALGINPQSYRYIAKIDYFQEGWKFTIENDATYTVDTSLLGTGQRLAVTVHSVKYRGADQQVNLTNPEFQRQAEEVGILDTLVNLGTPRSPLLVTPLKGASPREFTVGKRQFLIISLSGSETPLPRGGVRQKRTFSLCPLEGDPYLATIDLQLATDGYPTRSDVTIRRGVERVTIQLSRLPLLAKPPSKGANK